MNIGVIGANEKSEELIVKESVSQGADVTAVIRSDNRSVAKNNLKKFDGVVDALRLGCQTPCLYNSKTLAHLCGILDCGLYGSNFIF